MMVDFVPGLMCSKLLDPVLMGCGRRPFFEPGCGLDGSSGLGLTSAGAAGACDAEGRTGTPGCVGAGAGAGEPSASGAGGGVGAGCGAVSTGTAGGGGTSAAGAGSVSVCTADDAGTAAAGAGADPAGGAASCSRRPHTERSVATVAAVAAVAAPEDEEAVAAPEDEEAAAAAPAALALFRACSRLLAANWPELM